MGLIEQAKAFPTERETRFSDYELEESIRKLGPQRPALIWEGEILDGNRRLAACNKLGLELAFLEATDRFHAARSLYLAHPRRAFLTFAFEGIRRNQLAELFGVPPHKLPSSQQLRNARKPVVRRGGVAFYADKAVLGGIPIEREKLELAKKVCKTRGVSLSAWIREMIETELLAG